MLLGKFDVKKFVKTVREERRIKRQYKADRYKNKEAMNMAIDYCIDHNILSEFLKKNRSEVLDILLEELELIKFEKTVREDE